MEGRGLQFTPERPAVVNFNCQLDWIRKLRHTVGYVCEGISRDEYLRG